MKKIKSPWYGLVWMVVWTVGVIWLIASGRYNEKESFGLILVWLILVGSTIYVLIKYFRTHGFKPKPKPLNKKAENARTPLNAPCPCGSGKKYKRCCGSTSD
jgi:hypothetical protein